MKKLLEELILFDKNNSYSDSTKKNNNRKLKEFSHYLAVITETPIEELHLEKIYETVDVSGRSLYFSSLDVKLVEQYFLDNLDKSYSWLYQSRCALHSFFRYLYRKYDFPLLTDEMNFVLEEYKSKPEKREKHVLSRHELLKFLQSLLTNSINLERDALFFLLMITTGSRPSEIINVKIRDMDLLNETIFLKKTKNKSSKFIVLRDGFGDVLKRYIEKNELSTDDYLINNNGIRMCKTELQSLFNYFLNCANLPPTTLHKLRHSFATIMAESGSEIIIIQQLLGHKRMRSTHAYIDPNVTRNTGMEIQVNKEVYKHIKKLEKFY